MEAKRVYGMLKQKGRLQEALTWRIASSRSSRAVTGVKHRGHGAALRSCSPPWLAMCCTRRGLVMSLGGWSRAKCAGPKARRP